MMATQADCYKLVQQVVTARDRFCRAPGCSALSSAGHHIFPRARLATAFHPLYVIGLCAACHIGWAHGRPEEFLQWVVSWMGEGNYYAALRLSNTVVKNQDYDEIAAGLKNALTMYVGK